jgi:hypothetical protein
LGPYILGGRGWQQVSGPFPSWQAFVKEVEEQFGLSRDQIEEQFFGMHPAVGETSTAFVLWVESVRRRMGIDRASTYHAFVRRDLDLRLRERLDQVRWAKKATGNLRFGWEDVVTVCRDMQHGCTLGDEPPRQTVAPV